MKSLESFWHVLAQDLGKLCGTSTARDSETVRSRVKDEGDSFLTITLPSFCKDFEKSLSQGKVDPSLFLGFKKRGELPVFLRGFLDHVFDRVSGMLLDAPCIQCIRSIRQLTLVFSKVKLECSDRRKAAAIEGYIKCEQELKAQDRKGIDPAKMQAFSRTALLLFGDVFATMDELVYNGEIRPRHGSGATADRLRGNSKYVQTEWPKRLEEVFPYTEYALPNHRYHQMVSRVEFLDPGQERPVKVVLVPKTLKTPRVIAEEPTCMQYMQQALLRPLVSLLESSITRMGRSHIEGMLGFRDQEPNQRLAEIGSSSGSLATLDLSEASDRVSNQLVLSLLEYFPHFSEAVQATRSRRADVFGKTIRLSKFASMGSALCFPFEAMVFLTVIFLSIAEHDNMPVSLKMIKSFRGKVRVYGDDIIVPVEYVPNVISNLTNFGFKVNEHKSFWTGKFRESCGKEFYDGHDVSIVKCRSEFPSSRSSVSEIVSTTSLRNQLYESGLWDSARFLDELLTPILRGHFPAVRRESPTLGRWSFTGYDNIRLHPDTHIPLVKGWRVHSRSPVSRLDDVDALMKCLLHEGTDPLDVEHLERSGRPNALHIKFGWSPA